MTMRSIEDKYEFDDENRVEFDILINRMDEVAAGADIYVLSAALAALLVECVMQIEDMPEEEKAQFLNDAVTTAMMDHYRSIGQVQ